MAHLLDNRTTHEDCLRMACTKGDTGGAASSLVQQRGALRAWLDEARTFDVKISALVMDLAYPGRFRVGVRRDVKDNRVVTP